MLIFQMKARNKMFTIGVDLGGTNIAVGLVDENAQIVKKVSTPTGATRPAEEIVADIAKLCKKVCVEANIALADVQSIGIASPGIANHDNIACKLLLHLGFLNKLKQAGTTALFFTLKQEDNIKGQSAIFFDNLLYTKDVGHNFALIIRCAAGIHAAISHRGGKGVAVPLVQRVNGHHIVVTVDENSGLTLHLGAMCHNNGVNICKMLLGIKTQGGKLIYQEISATLHIRSVLCHGRYARDTQKGKKVIKFAHTHIVPYPTHSRKT